MRKLLLFLLPLPSALFILRLLLHRHRTETIKHKNSPIRRHSTTGQRYTLNRTTNLYHSDKDPRVCLCIECQRPAVAEYGGHCYLCTYEIAT